MPKSDKEKKKCFNNTFDKNRKSSRSSASPVCEERNRVVQDGADCFKEHDKCGSSNADILNFTEPPGEEHFPSPRTYNPRVGTKQGSDLAESIEKTRNSVHPRGAGYQPPPHTQEFMCEKSSSPLRPSPFVCQMGFSGNKKDLQLHNQLRSFAHQYIEDLVVPVIIVKNAHLFSPFRGDSLTFQSSMASNRDIFSNASSALDPLLLSETVPLDTVFSHGRIDPEKPKVDSPLSQTNSSTKNPEKLESFASITRTASRRATTQSRSSFYQHHEVSHDSLKGVVDVDATNPLSDSLRKLFPSLEEAFPVLYVNQAALQLLGRATYHNLVGSDFRANFRCYLLDLADQPNSKRENSLFSRDGSEKEGSVEGAVTSSVSCGSATTTIPPHSNKSTASALNLMDIIPPDDDSKNRDCAKYEVTQLSELFRVGMGCYLGLHSIQDSINYTCFAMSMEHVSLCNPQNTKNYMAKNTSSGNETGAFDFLLEADDNVNAVEIADRSTFFSGNKGLSSRKARFKSASEGRGEEDAEEPYLIIFFLSKTSPSESIEIGDKSDEALDKAPPLLTPLKSLYHDLKGKSNTKPFLFDWKNGPTSPVIPTDKPFVDGNSDPLVTSLSVKCATSTTLVTSSSESSVLDNAKLEPASVTCSSSVPSHHISKRTERRGNISMNIELEKNEMAVKFPNSCRNERGSGRNHTKLHTVCKNKPHDTNLYKSLSNFCAFPIKGLPDLHPTGKKKSSLSLLSREINSTSPQRQPQQNQGRFTQEKVFHKNLHGHRFSEKQQFHWHVPDPFLSKRLISQTESRNLSIFSHSELGNGTDHTTTAVPEGSSNNCTAFEEKLKGVEANNVCMLVNAVPQTCPPFSLPTPRGRKASTKASRLRYGVQSKVPKSAAYDVNPSSDSSNLFEQTKDQIHSTESLSQGHGSHWSDTERQHGTKKDFWKAWRAFGVVESTTKNTSAAPMVQNAAKPAWLDTGPSALSLCGKKEDTSYGPASGPQTPSNWHADAGHGYLLSDNDGYEWVKVRMNSESLQDSSQRYSIDNRGVITRNNSTALSPDYSNPRFISFSTFQDDQAVDSRRRQQRTLRQTSNTNLSSRPALTQRARTTDIVQVKNLQARLHSLKGIATVNVSKCVPATFIMNFMSFIILLQSAQCYQRKYGAEMPFHCFVNVRNTFIVVDLLPNTALQGMSPNEVMSQLEVKYAQSDKKIVREEQSSSVSEAERVSQTSCEITNSFASGVNKSSPQTDSLRIAAGRQFRLINQAFHMTHMPPQVITSTSISQNWNSRAASVSNGSMAVGTGLLTNALPDASLSASADGVVQDPIGFNQSGVASTVTPGTRFQATEDLSPEVAAYVPLEHVLPQELIDLLIHCNGSLNICRSSVTATLSFPYITRERLALLDSIETVQLSSQKGLFAFGVSLTNLLTEEAAAKRNLEGTSVLHDQNEENRSVQGAKKETLLKPCPQRIPKGMIDKDYRSIKGRQPSLPPTNEITNHSLVFSTELLTANNVEKKSLSYEKFGQGVQRFSPNSQHQSSHGPLRCRSSVLKFMADSSTGGNDAKASGIPSDEKNESTSPVSCEIAMPNVGFSAAGLATTAAGAALPSVLKSEGKDVKERFLGEQRPQAQSSSAVKQDVLKENPETQATSLSHTMLLATENPPLTEDKANHTHDRQKITISKNKCHVKPESDHFSPETRHQGDWKFKGAELSEDCEKLTNLTAGLDSIRTGFGTSDNDMTSSPKNMEATTSTAIAKDQLGLCSPKSRCSLSILRKNAANACTTSHSSSSTRKATKNVSFGNGDVGVPGLPQSTASMSFPSIPNDSLAESFPSMFRVFGTGSAFGAAKDSKKCEEARDENVNGIETDSVPPPSEDSLADMFSYRQASFEFSSLFPLKKQGGGSDSEESSSPLEAGRLFHLVIYTTEDRPDIEEELGRYGHCCFFITNPQKMMRYLKAGMDRFDLLLVEWNEKLVTPEIEKFLLEDTSKQTVVMYHITVTKEEVRNPNSHSKGGVHRQGGGTDLLLSAEIPESAILYSTDIASVFLNYRMQRQTLEYFFRKRLLREMLELRVIQPYQIVRQIGSGSAGDVFEVVLYASKGHLAMKRVFLKNMSLRGIERLSREVHILSSLDHSNIITFSHTCSAGNDFCIFMELCDGNLSQKIQVPASPTLEDFSNLSSPLSHIRAPRVRFGSVALSNKAGAASAGGVAGLTPISPEEAVLIIHDIASAIAYLHNQGIIHRDLKPENILFANNVAKLGDFGSAARVHERRSLTNMKGTLSYMAPEVILGEPYGKPCDMWSFGCVLADIMGLDMAHLIGLHIPALIKLYGSLSMAESLPVTIANLIVSRPEDVTPSTTSCAVLEAVRTASIQAAKERNDLESLYISRNMRESTPEGSPSNTQGNRAESQAMNIVSSTQSTVFPRPQRQKYSLPQNIRNSGGVKFMSRSSSVPPQLTATLPADGSMRVPTMMRRSKSTSDCQSSLDRRYQHQPNEGRFDSVMESSSPKVARTVTCISINKNSVIGTQMVTLPRSLVELLESLFHRDPAKRMTIEEVLEHPVSWDIVWMTNMMTALQQVNESITGVINTGGNVANPSPYSLKATRFKRGIGGERLGRRGNASAGKLSLSLNSSPIFVPDDKDVHEG